MLIAGGADVVTVSRRLGHAGPNITLGTYGHLFSNTDDRTTAIIEAAFTKGGKLNEENTAANGNRTKVKPSGANPVPIRRSAEFTHRLNG